MAASKIPAVKKRRRRNRILAGLMVFGLAFATATVASATNWSGPTGGTGCNAANMADNRTHTWNFEFVTAPWVNAMNYVRDYVNPNTVVTMQRVFTTTSTTDQVVYDRAYTTYCGGDWYQGPGDGTAVGHARCASTNSAAECEKHETRFSTVYSGDVGVTRERNVALHETGHAFGLLHRNVSTDVMYQHPNNTTTFSLHDRQHLQFLG